MQRVSQLRQDRAILAGSALALLRLASGALSETRNLAGLETVIICSASVTILVAVAMFYAAGQEGVLAHRLAEVLV